MYKVGLIFFFLPIVFLISCDVSSEKEESIFYQISQSKEYSRSNNLLLKEYDIELYKENDTVLLRDYAWVENKWYQKSDGHGKVSIITISDQQLVIPVNEKLQRCNGKTLTECHFELVDDEGRYFSRMDTVYAYRILSKSDLTNAIFYTEIDNKKIYKMKLKQAGQSEKL